MNALILMAVAAAATNVPATKIPLIKGLTLYSAVSERQGDYESYLTVDSIDADGSLHLLTEADIPDPAGGKPTHLEVTRTVRAADMKTARTFKYMYSNAGEEEYPGSTSVVISAAVFADIRSKGEASVKIDGEVGGIADMMGGALAMMQAAQGGKASKGYLTALGIVKLAEPKPVPFKVIVNNAVVSLPAWHLKGRFGEGDEAVNVGWSILDDPDNPLSLGTAFGKDGGETVRIEFPAENEAQSLEQTLSEKKRATVYGIYFDFNSAVIKPRSEKVLRTIVEVMKKDPDWILTVEGHTDNIGGNARNQELSAARAAAVKAALVERGVPADHLDTSGHGASNPKETNKTLAGRARNRRVELTRQ